MITRTSAVILLSLISVLNLAGCSSSSDIKKNSATTEDVYFNDGTNTQGNHNNSSTVPWRPTTSYERSEIDVYTLHNSPRAPFAMLDNPTIYIYTPPKLSPNDRIPIPGYFSEFKLFERDEYALPSERNLSNTENHRYEY